MPPSTSDPRDNPHPSAWTIDIDAADERTLASPLADEATDKGDLADVASEQPVRFSPLLVDAGNGRAVRSWPQYAPELPAAGPPAREATSEEATRQTPTALRATRATTATAVRSVSGAARAARTVLGLASLAGERLREQAGDRLSQTPAAGDGLATGIGLLQDAGDGLQALGRLALRPPARLVEEARRWSSAIPGADLPARSVARVRNLPRPWRALRVTRALPDPWHTLRLLAAATVARAVEHAQQRGRDTIAAGRDDARAMVRTGVDQSLKWAHERAVPRLFDGFVPYLVESVVPRVLDGSLPQIRATVVPALIDELSSSPQLRELVVDQGRDLVDDAADQIRGRTSRADDRVESAFRRLVGHAGSTVHEGQLGDPNDASTMDRPPWADDR